MKEATDVMLETLASHTVPERALDPRLQYFAMFVLARMALDPNTAVAEDGGDWYGRDGGWGNGPQLLYVEAGQIVVMMNGDRTTVARDGSTLVPEGKPFVIRNESGGCASVLQLAFLLSEYGRGGPVPERPPPIPMTCGDRRVLISVREAPWRPRVQGASPRLLFLARMHQAAGDSSPEAVAALAHLHPGPVAFGVEAGTLRVEIHAPHDVAAAAVQVVLPKGGQIGIPAHVPHAEWSEEETAAFVVGLAPQEQDWLIGPAPESANGIGPAEQDADS